MAPLERRESGSVGGEGSQKSTTRHFHLSQYSVLYLMKAHFGQSFTPLLLKFADPSFFYFNTAGDRISAFQAYGWTPYTL